MPCLNKLPVTEKDLYIYGLHTTDLKLQSIIRHLCNSRFGLITKGHPMDESTNTNNDSSTNDDSNTDISTNESGMCCDKNGCRLPSRN